MTRRRKAWLTPLRSVLVFLAVVTSSFLLYTSNAQTLTSYDSAPNSLVALNVLKNHRLDFDAFRGSYFTALGGQYAFTEAPNGHLTSVFPIGTAVVTLPLYVFFSVTQSDIVRAGALNSSAFEPIRVRYEKTVAAAVAAVSVACFLLCAREIGNPTQAATATIVYALATPIWSIGSQALWQHGPVNLFVLAMVYALLRASRANASTRLSAWLATAGICAGLLPAIRPTAVLFSLAGLVFAGAIFRRASGAFIAAFVIGASPAIAWNLYFFHSFAGGYAANAGSYHRSPHDALGPFAALLVSPSRGMLAFSPVLAFALAGAARAWTVRDRAARLMLLLAAACVALVVQYAFFRDWWAGFAYGPRFLSDIAAVSALLLVYVVPHDPLSYVRRSRAAFALTASFTLLFVFSVTVQFAGTNSGAAGSEWNAVPISIDRRPDRVWQLADSQIERNIRAMYFRLFAWNVAGSSSYDRGLAARVTAISPSFINVARGATIETTALVQNDGRSPLYGYDTGVYIGQLRVRVRIRSADMPMPSEQLLYVRGSPPPGKRTAAVGTIAIPKQAGRYRLECEPFVVGGNPIVARPAAFAIVMQVR